MKYRHIRMEYPGKQIELWHLPLIYCRSILLFSFFFPSELEINNSAGNHSVLVTNSLTSHPISFSPSPSCPLNTLYFDSSYFCSICFHSCVPALCVCMFPKSLCVLCEWWFNLLAHSPPLPSSFPSFLHPPFHTSLLVPQMPSGVAVTWSPQMTWSIRGSTGRWGTALVASPMWAWCILQSIATLSVLPKAWRPWPTSTRLTWNARGTPLWITWRASTNSSSSCSIPTTAHTTIRHLPHPPMLAWEVLRSVLHENRYLPLS